MNFHLCWSRSEQDALLEAWLWTTWWWVLTPSISDLHVRRNGTGGPTSILQFYIFLLTF